MARVLKQVVNQYDVSGLPERCIIQWTDEEAGGDDQVIIDSADMTAAQKAIFDNYKNLVEQLMID